MDNIVRLSLCRGLHGNLNKNDGPVMPCFSTRKLKYPSTSTSLLSISFRLQGALNITLWGATVLELNTPSPLTALHFSRNFSKFNIRIRKCSIMHGRDASSCNNHSLSTSKFDASGKIFYTACFEFFVEINLERSKTTSSDPNNVALKENSEGECSVVALPADARSGDGGTW